MLGLPSIVERILRRAEFEASTELEISAMLWLEGVAKEAGFEVGVELDIGTVL